MFIVFNKQKIYSYIIALSTVVILFVIAFAVTSQPNNALQTSTNIEGNNMVNNQLNNVTINQNNTTKINQNNIMDLNENY